jgi:hypothetical protein
MVLLFFYMERFMQLNFTHEKNPIAKDRYTISLKATNIQSRAILKYHPSRMISLPQSWAGYQQGIVFMQFTNTVLSLPLPAFPKNDDFAKSQQQSEMTNLAVAVEGLTREFMRNSPTTNYSDGRLVITRKEHEMRGKRRFFFF